MIVKNVYILLLRMQGPSSVNFVAMIQVCAGVIIQLNQCKVVVWM